MPFILIHWFCHHYLLALLEDHRFFIRPAAGVDILLRESPEPGVYRFFHCLEAYHSGSFDERAYHGGVGDRGAEFLPCDGVGIDDRHPELRKYFLYFLSALPGINDYRPILFQTERRVFSLDERWVQDYYHIRFVHFGSQFDRILRYPQKRLHRRPPAFGTETRETLGEFAVFYGGYRADFNRGNRSLSTPAVKSHLNHIYPSIFLKK